MPFGKIAGLAVGFFVAEFFILPHGILRSLHDMTTDTTNLVRLVAAVVVTIILVVLGHSLDRR